MSKSSERRIIRDKIAAFGAVACMEKAIEESAEKHEALLHLRDMLKHGTHEEIIIASCHYAEECADDEIAGKETLFRIFTWCYAKYNAKRNRAYREQIPAALAELSSVKTTNRDIVFDDENQCDGCGMVDEGNAS